MPCAPKAGKGRPTGYGDSCSGGYFRSDDPLRHYQTKRNATHLRPHFLMHDVPRILAAPIRLVRSFVASLQCRIEAVNKLTLPQPSDDVGKRADLLGEEPARMTAAPERIHGSIVEDRRVRSRALEDHIAV